MKKLKIPEATVIRLSGYSRFLKQLEQNGVNTVSSADIAEGVDGSPAQVRKDLAYFGEFGTRGVGYNVTDLNDHIIKILGLNSSWKVIIVGAGNLGSALTQYKGFKERGFDILALFDNDKTKIGHRISGVPIYDVREAETFIKGNEVKIAIVAVPAAYAQETVNMLARAGVKAILNFAPQVIAVPPHVEYRKVDLAVNLEVLTFNVISSNRF